MKKKKRNFFLQFKSNSFEFLINVRSGFGACFDLILKFKLNLC